jgi:hypothetical protein
MCLEKDRVPVYNASMTTVKEIEKAVEHLPPEGLSQFRKWFEDFEAAAWDQQLEADAKSGRLDLLVI